MSIGHCPDIKCRGIAPCLFCGSGGKPAGNQESDTLAILWLIKCGLDSVVNFCLVDFRTSDYQSRPEFATKTSY